MKLASFTNHNAEIRIGLKLGEKLADLTAGFEKYLVEEEGVRHESAVQAASSRMPTSMLALIQREEEGQADLRAVAAYLDRVAEGKEVMYAPSGAKISYALEEVKLLKPIPQLRRCFNVGVNYPEFQTMMGVIGPEENKTCMFMVTPESTIGPEDVIQWPQSAQEVCAELELGVIIGRTGKRISQAHALDYVFGYTVVDDVTGMDIIAKGLGTGREGLPGAYYITRAKTFDTFQPMGPYIALKDEIQDPQNVSGELRINGETKIRGNTKDMRCSVRRLIEYLSEDITFYPGDLLSSGGMGTKEFSPHAFVNHGDVIEAELEKIGVLRHYVA
jgi:5-oxopent-3-ene-1,2,5-tricarboxylate decarboxylase/2-hydroxyhepta-2,4-diene-1,7-dioate isomerase